MRSPATRALYSASLLDASNSNLMAQVNFIPSEFVRMNPTPDSSRHDDPSVNRVYGFGIASLTYVSVGGPSSFSLSAMKSAKT
ncbi:hypothetical protein Tco_0516772 [Tanacetum coccineum]